MQHYRLTSRERRSLHLKCYHPKYILYYRYKWQHTKYSWFWEIREYSRPVEVLMHSEESLMKLVEVLVPFPSHYFCSGFR